MIAVVTLLYQIQDPNFTKGVVWVIVWFVVAIIYFALVGRNKLILSPEEEFAMSHKSKSLISPNWPNRKGRSSGRPFPL